MSQTGSNKYSKLIWLGLGLGPIIILVLLRGLVFPTGYAALLLTFLAAAYGFVASLVALSITRGQDGKKSSYVFVFISLVCLLLAGTSGADLLTNRVVSIQGEASFTASRGGQQHLYIKNDSNLVAKFMGYYVTDEQKAAIEKTGKAEVWHYYYSGIATKIKALP